MRRSSIITIILLVLVIIGLVVALVVTNLPKENNNEVNIENNENLPKEETPKEEKPIELSLDSEIPIEMAKMTDPTGLETYFYNIKMGKITQESLSNEEKMIVAYLYEAHEKIEDCFYETQQKYGIKLKKSDLDSSIKKMFGNEIDSARNFKTRFNNFEYNAEDETFYSQYGGGGGYCPLPIVGIYKVEEYENRYEAYSKYLVEVPHYVEGDEKNYGGMVNLLYKQDSLLITPLIAYKDDDRKSEILKNYKTFGEIVSGVEMKNFAKVKERIGNERECKLLSKYYDEATEYKHTFMKNPDGTFYWVKSEIIK